MSSLWTASLSGNCHSIGPSQVGGVGSSLDEGGAPKISIRTSLDAPAEGAGCGDGEGGGPNISSIKLKSTAMTVPPRSIIKTTRPKDVVIFDRSRIAQYILCIISKQVFNLNGLPHRTNSERLSRSAMEPVAKMSHFLPSYTRNTHLDVVVVCSFFPFPLSCANLTRPCLAEVKKMQRRLTISPKKKIPFWLALRPLFSYCLPGELSADRALSQGDNFHVTSIYHADNNPPRSLASFRL